MEAIFILFIVVGLPVTLGIGYAAFERHLKFKERQLKAITNETAEKAAQYAAQTERLEARVRVLERIATDKGTALSAEIESLRLPPLN